MFNFFFKINLLKPVFLKELENLYKEIDFQNWRGLPNLVYLSVFNLKLTNTSFNNLSRLERLESGGCDFIDITNEAFEPLCNLKYLSISFSDDISHLTFTSLPRLAFLHIYNIESFHADLFTNPNLLFVSLRLSDPYFTSNELLSELKNTNLKVLDLGNGYFPFFDTSFLSGLTSLQNLKIEDAAIQSIRFSGENLSNLKSLNLKANKIEALDSTVSKLNGLKLLDLSSNGKLKSSPDMFMGLDNLERLDLSNCDCLSEIQINIQMFSKPNN